MMQFLHTQGLGSPNVVESSVSGTSPAQTKPVIPDGVKPAVLGFRIPLGAGAGLGEP